SAHGPGRGPRGEIPGCGISAPSCLRASNPVARRHFGLAHITLPMPTSRSLALPRGGTYRPFPARAGLGDGRLPDAGLADRPLRMARTLHGTVSEDLVFHADRGTQ